MYSLQYTLIILTRDHMQNYLFWSCPESTVAFWASSNFLMRLITSSILRPSLKQNKTSLRIQHKYVYLSHILNGWNTQESIVLSINKMNSPRGASASPKRIKNDNIMPCYETHNKNKKFKHPKEPTKYVRNRKRK